MTKLKEVADDYGSQYDREEGELPDGEQEFVDLHTIQVAPHPISGDEHFKALNSAIFYNGKNNKWTKGPSLRAQRFTFTFYFFH